MQYKDEKRKMANMENNQYDTEIIKKVKGKDPKPYTLEELNREIIATSILKETKEKRWADSPSSDIRNKNREGEEWDYYSSEALEEKLSIIIQRYTRIKKIQINAIKEVKINDNVKKSEQDGNKDYLYLKSYYELGLVSNLYKEVFSNFDNTANEENFRLYPEDKLKEKLEAIIEKYSELKTLQISTLGRAKINDKFIVEQEDEPGRTGYLRLKGYGDLGMAWTLTAETWLEKAQGRKISVHHITNNGYDNSIKNIIYLPWSIHCKIDHKLNK